VNFDRPRPRRRQRILVVDVGGTNVKTLATGQTTPIRIPSGPDLTPQDMVPALREAVSAWRYDMVSIGYPGPVVAGKIAVEPRNLGSGWVGYDFEAAFERPVRILNDAAMQALGGYRGGKMLFLGLGTGLGSALIIDEVLVPMELGHLPYRKATFEDYVGLRGLEKHGRKKWRSYVKDVVVRLVDALLPEDVVLGGGNAKLLGRLPRQWRRGDNADAFAGGFRLWKSAGRRSRAAVRHTKRKAA
jgi:polyphosphate glucokinase